ncbi:MAG: multifunctional CCA addition/repair protein [Ectothiorhodospiraceae bacterium]|nr:multifunctional CCA addition/repair protein [Ectothiorhodospiraceae bacterium]
MDVYLVGGAVRDRLLGRAVKERDWGVGGATPAEMERRGFRPVGKDFPVFLHPASHEEYALARTERKTARGYHGFSFHAAPDVTLEQDLARRDLTVNAMAERPDGTLVDPFNGYQDLERRLLRHVSDAFREDPVRILRLARFTARYAPLGFRPAEETVALARQMAADGEVDALVPERVWQEMAKALGEERPSAFIQVLRDCGALVRLLPELEALFGVPQRPEYHPEVDSGVHTLMVLDQAARLSDSTEVRFAALMHDLGKGATPEQDLPRHIGHERRGIPLVREVCARYKVPNAHRELALMACEHHLNVHRAPELRPETVLKLLERCDAFRRPERFHALLLACEADARGRTGFEERDYPQRPLLAACLETAAAIDGGAFAREGLQGKEIARALREARLDAIRAVKEARSQEEMTTRGTP